MRLRTRRGDPVDPVPVLVVVLSAFLFIFSVGPVYGLSLGFSLVTSIAASVLVFLACVVVCYHQMVWVARPDLAGETPVELRLRRLFVGIVLVILLLLLLNIPFL